MFPCSAVFQSATPADRTSCRSSSVVGACAARARVRADAAMRSARGREQRAGQRGTEVRNKKKAACVLQGWDTEKAVPFQWARYGSCDSSPVQKETLWLLALSCAKKAARVRVRARATVRVPAAACGNGDATMQLWARAHSNGYGSARDCAWRCQRKQPAAPRVEQARAREQDTRHKST